MSPALGLQCARSLTHRTLPTLRLEQDEAADPDIGDLQPVVVAAAEAEEPAATARFPGLGGPAACHVVLGMAILPWPPGVVYLCVAAVPLLLLPLLMTLALTKLCCSAGLLFCRRAACSPGETCGWPNRHDGSYRFVAKCHRS